MVSAGAEPAERTHDRARGVVVQQRGGHLGAAGVVDTDEAALRVVVDTRAPSFFAMLLQPLSGEAGRQDREVDVDSGAHDQQVVGLVDAAVDGLVGERTGEPAGQLVDGPVELGHDVACGELLTSRSCGVLFGCRLGGVRHCRPPDGDGVVVNRRRSASET